MILRTGLGLAVALLIGSAWVAAFWPTEKQSWPNIVLRLAVASGVGLGVSSAGLFLMLCAFGNGGDFYFLIDGVILLLAGLAWWCNSRSSHPARPVLPSQAEAPASSASELLRGLLAAALAVAVVGFVRLSLRKPNGEFDAWTIWNLHARFLFRGREHWADMFSPLLPAYNSRMVAGIVSKPDYPLLLPASIARLWHYTGSEGLLAPAVIGGIFTFATAALLVALLARCRGTTQGCLAGLILLGTPTLIEEGAHQFADIPLGFFLLATLGLLYMSDCYQERGYLILAGVTAGLSLWTKNEGVVLVAAILCVRWVFDMRFRELRAVFRHSLWFFSGMAPLLATVIYFKIRFATSNDMLAGQGIHAHAARFTSLIRYATTARAFASQAWNFGDWPLPILLVLALYALLVGVHTTSKDAFAPLATVMTAAAGYFFIYVGTPHQLEWHLRYSLDRVLMQLWPSALFGIFILLNTPDEATFASSSPFDAGITRQQGDLISS